MSDDLKPGDWINMVTAFGAVGTGIIGIFSFLLLRRQARITSPTLDWHVGSTDTKGYGHLTLFVVEDGDRKRFFIHSIKRKRPIGARVAHVVKSLDQAGGSYVSDIAKWEKRVSFDDSQLYMVDFAFKAPPGSTLSLLVRICLRADERVTSLQLIKLRMRD